MTFESLEIAYLYSEALLTQTIKYQVQKNGGKKEDKTC